MLTWEWHRDEGYVSFDFILTNDSLLEINEDLEGGWGFAEELQTDRYFTNLNDNYKLHRLACSSAHFRSNMSFEFPEGKLTWDVRAIYGRATEDVCRALGVEPGKGQEVWLEAEVSHDSAWVPRILRLSDWGPSSDKLNSFASKTVEISPGGVHAIRIASPKQKAAD